MKLFTPSKLPDIAATRLLPIGVAAPQRLSPLPYVPAFKEVFDQDNAAVRKALVAPAVKNRIEATGAIVIGNMLEQFAEQIRAEYAVYKKVVESAKLQLD